MPRWFWSLPSHAFRIGQTWKSGLWGLGGMNSDLGTSVSSPKTLLVAWVYWSTLLSLSFSIYKIEDHALLTIATLWRLNGIIYMNCKLVDFINMRCDLVPWFRLRDDGKCDNFYKSPGILPEKNDEFRYIFLSFYSFLRYVWQIYSEIAQEKYTNKY